VTNTIKNIMAFKKESSGKGLGKKVFREYVILWIIILTIFGVLLICVGYNITETDSWAWAKIPCISIGSSLLGIGPSIYCV
jgi:hypothetical protein